MSQKKIDQKSKFSALSAKGRRTVVETKRIIPKTENQSILFAALNTKQVVIVDGPAGSGKTYLSAGVAASKLLSGEVASILISRPMVGVAGKEIGHLPGDETDKITPFLQPLIQCLKDFLGDRLVETYIKEKIIKVVPISLLRGYTFKNTVVIIDEAQNTTDLELKTILTRVGDRSFLYVLSDTDQSDLKGGYKESGIYKFNARIQTHNPLEEYLSLVKLNYSDIIRSEFVKAVVKLYATTGDS